MQMFQDNRPLKRPRNSDDFVDLPIRFRNAPGSLVDLPGDSLSNITAFDGTPVLSNTFANQLGHYQGAVLFPRHDNIDDIIDIPDEELEGLHEYRILDFDKAIANRLEDFVQSRSVKNLRIEFHMDRMREEFGTGTPPGRMTSEDRVTIAMRKMATVLRKAPYLENLALVTIYPYGIFPYGIYDPNRPSPYRWHNFYKDVSQINNRNHLTSFTFESKQKMGQEEPQDYEFPGLEPSGFDNLGQTPEFWRIGLERRKQREREQRIIRTTSAISTRRPRPSTCSLR